MGLFDKLQRWVEGMDATDDPGPEDPSAFNGWVAGREGLRPPTIHNSRAFREAYRKGLKDRAKGIDHPS